MFLPSKNAHSTVSQSQFALTNQVAKPQETKEFIKNPSISYIKKKTDNFILNILECEAKIYLPRLHKNNKTTGNTDFDSMGFDFLIYKNTGAS